MQRIRHAIVGGVMAVAMTAMAAGPAAADTNHQSGLVNVNVTQVAVQVPVSST